MRLPGELPVGRTVPVLPPLAHEVLRSGLGGVVRRVERRARIGGGGGQRGERSADLRLNALRLERVGHSE